MEKRNCWEIRSCGLGPRANGRAGSLPICPAARPGVFEGTNDGEFRGRFCWAIPETLCCSHRGESVHRKLSRCVTCPVMNEVGAREGQGVRSMTPWRQHVDEYA